ncbi:hypothetical protein CAQUA_07990 [Corynebacterium aquatimens]|nr:hypothetical protein CAQUA_07990 [Corynebacterium aquatimens]
MKLRTSTVAAVAAASATALLLTGCSAGVEISNVKPTATAEKKDDVSSKGSSERSTKSTASESGGESSTSKHDGVYMTSLSEVLRKNPNATEQLLEDEFSEAEMEELEAYFDMGEDIYMFLEITGEKCSVSMSETGNFADAEDPEFCTIDYEKGTLDTGDDDVDGTIKFRSNGDATVVMRDEEITMTMVFKKTEGAA